MPKTSQKGSKIEPEGALELDFRDFGALFEAVFGHTSETYAQKSPLAPKGPPK